MTLNNTLTLYLIIGLKINLIVLLQVFKQLFVKVRIIFIQKYKYHAVYNTLDDAKTKNKTLHLSLNI